MENTITTTAKALLSEMRKDITFFGACGVLTGLLMVWQHRLQVIGVGKDTAFSMNLFSDFVSFSAFGLIFIGLVALGTIQTIILRFGWHWRWLASTVAHLEGRLTQFASTIVSFMLGLLAIALLYSFLNLETDGARLAVIAIPFCFVICAGHVAAIAIVRREPPFEKWWAALFFFASALVLLTILILRGTGAGD